MDHHVDGLKFAGGSFSLFPEDKLKELINLAHEYNFYVSTVRPSETLCTQSLTDHNIRADGWSTSFFNLIPSGP